MMTPSDATPPAPHIDARRGVRALDGLVTLLVGAWIAGVAVVVAPIALRAAGLGPPLRARLDARVEQPRPSLTAGSDFPVFNTEPAEDDEDSDPLDPMVLRPGWAPGKPMPRRDRHERAAPSSDGGDDGHRVRVAFARSAIDLRKEPRDTAAVMDQVPQGATLIVLREADRWALVAYSGDDGVAMGWAPSERLALR